MVDSVDVGGLGAKMVDDEDELVDDVDALEHTESARLFSALLILH